MEVWYLLFYFLRQIRKQIDLHWKVEFPHCGARWKILFNSAQTEVQWLSLSVESTAGG